MRRGLVASIVVLHAGFAVVLQKIAKAVSSHRCKQARVMQPFIFLLFETGIPCDVSSDQLKFI